MTTVSELKAMLREEIAEPLNYPRVPWLSPEELQKYNEGYRSSCEIVMKGADDISEDVFLSARIKSTSIFVERYEGLSSPWSRGKGDAYTWILGELRGIESGTAELGSPWSIVRAWVEGESTPAGVLQTAIDAITVEQRGGGSEALSIIRSCFDAPDSVLIPRARYNHLLDMEKAVIEFTENFTRWEA